MSTPDYELSERQRKFVDHAESEGFAIDYGYSGRGMYGKCCPAVRLKRDQIGDFGFKGASTDSLGLGMVIYMR